MDFIFVSDTHIGLKNDSPIWHKASLDLFETIVDVCSKRDVRNILHLGDWFHNRKTINLKTIDVAYEIAETLKDFEVWLIAGNHDTFFKYQIEPTSLDLFKGFENFHIIKETSTVNDILLCPWGGQIPERGDLLLGHFEIGGFPLNQSYTLPEKNRLKVADFSNFGQVFSGHFHTPSSKGNVTYLGAPFQMTFGDKGERGFYVFENGNMEFIRFTEAPEFVKITTDAPFTSKEIEGNIVKVIYVKDYGRNENNKILESIQSLRPAQLYVDFSESIKIAEVKDSIDEQVKENKDILFEFMDKTEVPEHLNRRTLKVLIENLMKNGR